MKNLKNLYIDCLFDLDCLGIEYGNIADITINTRAKKRWGQCSLRNGKYYININVDLLNDNLDDMAVKNTIVHEILHTCKGCMNHGKEWQRLADIVNKAYSYYNIKRTSSYEEKGIQRVPKKIEYKYIFKCANCGQQIKRQKASAFTKNYEYYGCGRCHKYNTFIPTIYNGIECTEYCFSS